MKWLSPFAMGVIFKALLNNSPYGPDPANSFISLHVQRDHFAYWQLHVPFLILV